MTLLINENEGKIIKTFKTIRDAAAYMDANSLSTLEYTIEQTYRCPKCRLTLPLEYKTKTGICEMCAELEDEVYHEPAKEEEIVDLDSLL